MSPATGSKRVYFSVCAIYRNEAPYLREWVAFHRLMGAERFYLYNNRSSDAHLESLAPYLDDGTVDLRDWPIYPGQVVAYEDCVRQHREDARWIAFFDVDEFLFSPTGRAVSEVLVDYEAFPGVGVNLSTFGTSGHLTKPDGLVIENYVRRGRDDPSAPMHPIKSIVDPSRVERCHSSHTFIYRDGLAVDENKRPIDNPISETETLSRSVLCLNHYWTKSEEEGRRKFETPDARGRLRRARAEKKMFGGVLNEELDESITQYVPALREALASDARGTPAREDLAAPGTRR